MTPDNPSQVIPLTFVPDLFILLPPGPLLLSMIEKIKQAGLNKPSLGDAPLNLSAMLDNESSEDASRSGE